MPLETLTDVIEYVADKLGIYGAHGDENEDPPNDVTCTLERPCRMCFTSDLRSRIESAVEVDAKMAQPLRGVDEQAEREGK